MSKPSTPLLDQIDTPADLRKLKESDLTQLAAELRAETISAVSVTGGHLGAGLGVVAPMAAAAGGKHRDSERQQQNAAGFDKITQSQRRFLTMGSQTSGAVYPMARR